MVKKVVVLNICHLSYSSDESDGGISSILPTIIQEQVKSGLSVKWICSKNFPQLTRDICLYKKLNQIDFDILHVHGLWRSPTRVINFSSITSRNVPLIISPHGMLDEWALKKSYLKKKFAYKLWEKRALSKASCIQALCKKEFASIKKLLPNSNIKIIPNGINSFSASNCRCPLWENEVPINSKILLFFGRYHLKKGISELLSAWKQSHINAVKFNWTLVFVGYGDERYIKGRILKENIQRCKVYGPAFGKLKNIVFSNASAFILPSFSEGLPSSVLEAMKAKLPTIISSNCNMPEVFKIKAALKGEPVVDILKESLDSLMKMNQNELNEIAFNGFNFVSENYNWEDITNQLVSLYTSL